MLDVQSFIVLTPDQNLACITVPEKGFLIQNAFPKENTYVKVCNLQFVNCTRIDHRDLSFETFDTAIGVDSVCVSADDDHENFFVYDTFRFTVNSSIK